MEDSSSGGPPPPFTQDFLSLTSSLRSSVTPLSTAPGLLPTPTFAPLISSSSLPSFSAPPTSSLPPPSIPISSTSPKGPSLWTDLFTRASSIPKNFPPPKVSSDGIPIVKAPPSVLLKSSEMWKDFIMCYFFGEPPTFKKIFADLNPIWGKKGAIQIRPYSSSSCLILIPDDPLRDWVLDVGFWSAGTVAFSTALWTPSATLTHQTLTSAPVWLSLHNVPPQLWSIEGFELIASGVGDPLPSKKPLNPPAFSHGPPRVRAIVPLEQGPLPRTVIVEDDDGNQVPVDILIQGNLLNDAYVVVKDNAKMISQPTLQKFGRAFMISGNINLVNDVLKVLHGSGHKNDQVQFEIAISRYISQVDIKELLLQLLQWMPGQGYVVDSSTRNLILKNSHLFGRQIIAEILSKHHIVSRKSQSRPKFRGKG